MIQIQVQDEGGNWRTVSVTENVPAQIRARMSEAAWQYPNKRIRAINETGSVIDIF